MSNNNGLAIKRLRSELMDILVNSPIPNIYVAPKEDDVMNIDALIVGPTETPYEGGFYHFNMQFPNEYPFAPPKVKLVTTDSGRVRFNPNLYACGKVCLSILGTWNGPAWTSSQSISSVLLSIQSLMCKYPYHNEPGYEHERRPGDIQKYNERIEHENLRVAVCGMTEQPTCGNIFNDAMRMEFLERYDKYLDKAKKFGLLLNGTDFKDPFNEMQGKFDFKSILGRLALIKEKLDASLKDNEDGEVSDDDNDKDDIMEDD